MIYINNFNNSKNSNNSNNSNSNFNNNNSNNNNPYINPRLSFSNSLSPNNNSLGFSLKKIIKITMYKLTPKASKEILPTFSKTKFLHPKILPKFLK